MFQTNILRNENITLFYREVCSPAIGRRTRSRDRQSEDSEVVVKQEKIAREGSREKVCIFSLSVS